MGAAFTVLLLLSPPAGEVSEAALVRDILYVFQGIDGKFIKMSGQDNCYKIDAKVPELHIGSGFLTAIEQFSDIKSYRKKMYSSHI